jgi:hypothetical protein
VSAVQPPPPPRARKCRPHHCWERQSLPRLLTNGSVIARERENISGNAPRCWGGWDAGTNRLAGRGANDLEAETVSNTEPKCHAHQPDRAAGGQPAVLFKGVALGRSVYAAPRVGSTSSQSGGHCPTGLLAASRLLVNARSAAFLPGQKQRGGVAHRNGQRGGHGALVVNKGSRRWDGWVTRAKWLAGQGQTPGGGARFKPGARVMRPSSRPHRRCQPACRSRVLLSGSYGVRQAPRAG